MLISMVSFASLSLTPGQGVREFSMAGAMGSFLLFACTMTFQPLLLKPLLSWRMLRSEVLAVEAALGKLDLAERDLVEGPWVFGTTWSLSDGYLMVFERWARQAGLLDPARFPKLNAHLDLVQTREAVKLMLSDEGLAPV